MAEHAMTIIQTSLFDSPAYFCERCGRSLSNQISVAFHKGPVCRAKTGARSMETKIDMTQFGTRFDYKGYYGCACHCYINVIGNTVLCSEDPDNEGTSITNMAEGIAEQICKAYHIPMNKLIWIEHYPRDESQRRAGLDEDFSLVEFEISRDANPIMELQNSGLHFVHPKWTYLDRDTALRMIEQ
jgi:hypothetical protein